MSRPSEPSAGTARPDAALGGDVDALIKEFEDAVSNSWRGPKYHNAKAALRSALSAWQTEQTMHRAWRKRAEEVELEFTTVCSKLVEWDATIRSAVELIELGDQRLLAADGPAGKQAPDLSLAEWRKLYLLLTSAAVAPAAREEQNP